MIWTTTPIQLRCPECGIESKIRIRWMPTCLDSDPAFAEEMIAQKELSAEGFAKKHAACFLVPEDETSERSSAIPKANRALEELRAVIKADERFIEHFSRPAPGLYRVHWTTGNSSLAALGVLTNGARWLAPTNWVRPTEEMPWDDIERLELIECRIPETGAAPYQNLQRSIERADLVCKSCGIVHAEDYVCESNERDGSE